MFLRLCGRFSTLSGMSSVFDPTWFDRIGIPRDPVPRQDDLAARRAVHGYRQRAAYARGALMAVMQRS